MTAGTPRDPFWGPWQVPAMPRWEAMRFFARPAPPARQPFAERVAASPTLLAALLAGIGLFAVFVNQASIEIQIVIGAPVFEELLKFGLALLLVGWVPRGPAYLVPFVALLRIAVGWGVGAGFGILEHHVTYPDEPERIRWGRMLFHGGATGLSMATYTALEPAADRRVRFFATAPASVLHYANNVGAVALLAAPAAAGTLMSEVIVAAVFAATLAVPLSAAWWLPRAAALAALPWRGLPVVPEAWGWAVASPARPGQPAKAAAPPPAATPRR